MPTAPSAPVTRAAPHLRDGLDLRRAMRCVLFALLPCALAGFFNTGRQILLASAVAGLERPPGWAGNWLTALGLASDPARAVDCMAYGLASGLPILAVAWGFAWAWGALFAHWRARPHSEALPVIAVLFALSLPPGTALWQVALGVSFAVVVGLEIFGGTGRNVVNPAVAGNLFLYFAYPASFSGAGTWVALDGWSAEPLLAALARGGAGQAQALGITWGETLLGWQPGSLGGTSALACLVGGVFLLYARLASWRVIAGGTAGLIATAALANAFGDPSRALVGFPWSWHLTTGGFAFGIFFLATDPVTSAATPTGRWLYGGLIGFLVVTIRVFNPAHPEGVMMAILLGNVLAPFLDHLVVRVHVLRGDRRFA